MFIVAGRKIALWYCCLEKVLAGITGLVSARGASLAARADICQTQVLSRLTAVGRGPAAHGPGPATSMMSWHESECQRHVFGPLSPVKRTLRR